MWRKKGFHTLYERETGRDKGPNLLNVTIFDIDNNYTQEKIWHYFFNCLFFIYIIRVFVFSTLDQAGGAQATTTTIIAEN